MHSHIHKWACVYACTDTWAPSNECVDCSCTFPTFQFHCELTEVLQTVHCHTHKHQSELPTFLLRWPYQSVLWHPTQSTICSSKVWWVKDRNQDSTFLSFHPTLCCPQVLLSRTHHGWCFITTQNHNYKTAILSDYSWLGTALSKYCTTDHIINYRARYNIFSA